MKALTPSLGGEINTTPQAIRAVTQRWEKALGSSVIDGPRGSELELGNVIWDHRAYLATALKNLCLNYYRRPANTVI